MPAWRNSPTAGWPKLFRYLILDARYERVREAGVIASQAVLIAPPDPRPVQPSTVLAAVQTAARRLRRWPAASLDRGCARRSTGGQVGTKGWVCPIEQRDASFNLSSASPPPMTDLLNFAHTTRNP